MGEGEETGGWDKGVVIKVTAFQEKRG